MTGRTTGAAETSIRWAFGPPEDDAHDYADGITVPSRRWTILMDGEPVGTVEVHLHRRHGPDRIWDVSLGTTTVFFGPANPKADVW